MILIEFGGMDVVRWKQSSDALTIYLSGEIDHCAADKLKDEMELLIKKSKDRALVLDFSDVTFMDSSAVGMIIGRYKTKMLLGGRMYADGMHNAVERLYRMAGLHRIIPILEKERKAEA